mmetsp:Transcript_14013/g.33922  ORF Transcript_14013/g.33922 Transcript_14013/m.33922 type:complete len:291 (-) Transcript_14013:152-1024(-)
MVVARVAVIPGLASTSGLRPRHNVHLPLKHQRHDHRAFVESLSFGSARGEVDAQAVLGAFALVHAEVVPEDRLGRGRGGAVAQQLLCHLANPPRLHRRLVALVRRLHRRIHHVLHLLYLVHAPRPRHLRQIGHGAIEVHLLRRRLFLGVEAAVIRGGADLKHSKAACRACLHFPGHHASQVLRRFLPLDQDIFIGDAHLRLLRRQGTSSSSSTRWGCGARPTRVPVPWLVAPRSLLGSCSVSRPCPRRRGRGDLPHNLHNLVVAGRIRIPEHHDIRHGNVTSLCSETLRV